MGVARTGTIHLGSRAVAGMVIAVLLGTTWLLAATAPALASERLGSFGPDGTATSEFDRVSSVAIDQQTGNVYVLDAGSGTLYKFDAEGQPVDWGGASPYITGNRIDGISVFEELPELRIQSQIAVDSVSHVIYVTEEQSLRAFQANGEPFEFTAGPGAGSSEIPGFGTLTGVAVDVDGAIYAADRTGGVSIFAATGAPLTEVVTPEPANLAVASDGTLYVLPKHGSPDFGRKVERFTPDSFPVSGATVYTAGAPVTSGSLSWVIAGIAVDPLSDHFYALITNFGTTWVRQYDQAGAFLGSLGEPGTESEDEAFGDIAQGIAIPGGGKDISGNREVQFYVGDNEAEVFSKVAIVGSEEEVGPPDIEAAYAIDVTADSAGLRAWVDPNTAETTYRFEYGLNDCSLNPCTSVPVGGASIGDGIDPVEVNQALSGLLPGTTYHFRVVADNELGPPTESPDRTFTTQPLGLGFDLIDSRAWEMVSPPNKLGGQLVFQGLGGPRQAASDGDGVEYLSRGALEEPEGNRALENSAVLARRTSSGWVSEDIMPPNEQVAGFDLGAGSEYKIFSPDLSRAILSQRSGTLLSPQASERTIYLRENTQPPLYTPLVTGKEGFANVPPGTVFGGDETASSPLMFGGATPSLSHVVIVTSVPLVAGGSGTGYLWGPGGQIKPVSVLPDAEGGAFIPLGGGIGSFEGSMENAISDDGSRIFWERGIYFNGGNNTEALYVRDTLAEETARLDVPQSGASEAGTSRPVFLGASADGTVVFFKDSRQLTTNASPEGFDLYRCEIPPGPASSGCATLTDISVPVDAGESAQVLGLPAGLGEDGTRIYFVAEGVLDEAPNQYGDTAAAGEPNLYLWQEEEGARFIARLPKGDDSNWGRPDLPNHEGLSHQLTPLVSPSGRYLSFMSKASLTGYVNLDETSGEPAQEVFRYDAVADALDCVSCNPSGAAPNGEEVSPGNEVLPLSQWHGKVVAATIPERPNGTGITLYNPRAVLDNGRVFFNAIDSLVPIDSNGGWDVYQYEPLGVGGCSPSSGDAATAISAGGCISLLSSGTADEEAGFFDASVSGDDVFFLTPAKLSVTDKDDQLDLYDARVDGVPATLQPPTECQGEACQPPAVVPQDPTPGSATFKGKGNPKPAKTCPKGKHRVRRKGKVRCVPRKHHRHQRHDRRAGKSGRAGR